MSISYCVGKSNIFNGEGVPGATTIKGWEKMTAEELANAIKEREG